MCISYLRQSRERSRQILISVRGAGGRGVTGAWAPSARLLLCYRRHFFASTKDRVQFWCHSIILTSSTGACARRFLVMDAARLVPAPHMRDKNLIEGAGASILEQRNGRGTSEEQQLSLLIISAES